MTQIFGAILAAVTLGTYLRYKPRLHKYCCKTLGIAGAASIVAMAIPITGLLQWIGMGLLGVLLLCVFIAARDYRLENRARRHHMECIPLREIHEGVRHEYKNSPPAENLRGGEQKQPLTARGQRIACPCVRTKAPTRAATLMGANKNYGKFYTPILTDDGVEIK